MGRNRKPRGNFLFAALKSTRVAREVILGCTELEVDTLDRTKLHKGQVLLDNHALELKEEQDTQVEDLIILLSLA
jgi:hypothetical protein